MEDSVKKPIMVVLIVACLVLAVVVTVKTRKKAGGIPKKFAEEEVWVKCRNTACESEYEVNKLYYHEYIVENRTGLTAPPLVCEECSEDSVYKAFKCTNPDCEIVFEAWSAGMAEREDRCPKCNRSESEEEAKRYREEARARRNK